MMVGFPIEGEARRNLLYIIVQRTALVAQLAVLVYASIISVILKLRSPHMKSLLDNKETRSRVSLHYASY